jgi:hypothetical protein
MMVFQTDGASLHRAKETKEVVNGVCIMEKGWDKGDMRFSPWCVWEWSTFTKQISIVVPRDRESGHSVRASQVAASGSRKATGYPIHYNIIEKTMNHFCSIPLKRLIIVVLIGSHLSPLTCSKTSVSVQQANLRHWLWGCSDQTWRRAM